MSPQSSLDRESFQALLADAFAVQESGLEAQSLSAFVEIHRIISGGAADVNLAMQTIAGRSRAIAYASGAAVALLQHDQLVYRAGSGSAARNLGHHLPAVLTVSGHNGARREILRVENAQTDTRIEGAICRQFGAAALLILPIYRERILAGVLEILFNDPHNFRPEEVRGYRLMAGLAGDALVRDAAEKEKETAIALPVPVSRVTRHIPDVPMFQLLSGSDPGLWMRLYEFVRESVPDFSAVRSSLEMGIAPQTPGRILPDRLGWNWLALPALLSIAICSWIAYDLHRSPLPLPAPRANVPGPAPVALFKTDDKDQPRKTTAGARADSPFRRISIGNTEIDFVADDVTIRHFDSTPPAQAQSGKREVNIGEDVTMHYYTSTPANAGRLQPAAAVQTSPAPSSPMSK